MDTQTRNSGSRPTCRGCALMLAMKCYEIHWWFRLVREPLVLGMRFLAMVNRIDVNGVAFRGGRCKGCIRFLKSELSQKSRTFNLLNSFIGPRFSRLRNGMLPPEILVEAKAYAAKAESGE